MRRFGVLASLFACSCGSAGTSLNTLVDESFEGGVGALGVEGGSTSFQDPFAGAPAYQASTGGNTHNAGKSCIQQGCHASGGSSDDAQPFLIGGTVYTDYAGKTPAVGIEIRVIDGNGNTASTYSGTSGTFYIPAGKASVALPAYVGARDGTTERPMITQLTGTMGSCGQSSCHVSGGIPANGYYYPIHVP